MGPNKFNASQRTGICTNYLCKLRAKNEVNMMLTCGITVMLGWIDSGHQWSAARAWRTHCLVLLSWNVKWQMKSRHWKDWNWNNKISPHNLFTTRIWRDFVWLVLTLPPLPDAMWPQSTPPRALDMSHSKGGETVLVIRQFSHNPLSL